MFYPFIRPSWDRQSSSTEVLRWVTSRLEQQKHMCVDRVGFTHDLWGSTIISRALIMNLVCFDADFSQL